MGVRAVMARLDRFTAREKLATVCAFLVVFMFVPYQFIYLPSDKQIKQKVFQVQGLTSEISLLEKQVKALAVIRPVPAPEPEVLTLPAPESLSSLFRAISKKASELGVEQISIKPEGVVAKDRFTEMKVTVQMKLKYKDFHDFLKYMADKHKLMVIESIKFETNDAVYPAGIGVIKATTYLRKR